MCLVLDFKEYVMAVVVHSGGTMSMLSRSQWVPPRAARIRININAVVMDGLGVRLGVVMRDSDGMLLAVAVRICQARWPATMAEAQAAIFGLKVAQGLAYSHVELETDALNLAKADDSKKFVRSPVELLYEDVLMLQVDYLVSQATSVLRFLLFIVSLKLSLSSTHRELSLSSYIVKSYF
ncbi:hypothetical protein BVRB_4g086790 [Beta vulgaris subsp. vulgaris]|nr:hypothetical protein BVRB_4g086790 [Beta vulgaris subsp. vulgaris]